MTTLKKFNDLTLTEQRHFANRFTQGLPFNSTTWLRLLQELNPDLMNCRVKGSGWAFLSLHDFVNLYHLMILKLGKNG